MSPVPAVALENRAALLLCSNWRGFGAKAASAHRGAGLDSRTFPKLGWYALLNTRRMGCLRTSSAGYAQRARARTGRAVGQISLRFAGLTYLRGSLVGVFHRSISTSLLAPPITGRLMDRAAAFEDSLRLGRRVLANGLKQDASESRRYGRSCAYGRFRACAVGCPTVAFATINDSRSL